MELKKSDVIIVSIHGRGHGLAADLKRKGLEVTLIDLTSQMGSWPAEDLEGPFGFFKTENLSPSFLEKINTEDPYQSLDHGWTFWTEKGPLEMKGPTTQYRLRNWGWSDALIESMSNDKASLQFYKAARGLGFYWPAVMAHTIANTYDLSPLEVQASNKKLPLSADFSIRFSTRQGLQKSLQWLRDLDVQVTSDSQILDLAQLNSAQWSGFEFQGELSGIHMASYFVWTLTSEETHFYSQKLQQKIFKKEKQEPVWCWVRYRARLPLVPEVKVLPMHFVLIGDENAPWTHDNLIITQRTNSSDQFDFWLKIPSLQRFNKEYLTHLWQKISERWQARDKNIIPTLVSHPQEFYYTYEELGASPYSLFDRQAWLKFKKHSPAKNAWLHSSEQWENFSAGSLFENQQMIENKIWNAWKQEQLRKEKNVIERYTRPEMGVLWDDDHKFGKMLEVELAVAITQAELGIIPRVAAKAIKQKAKFSVRRIRQIEKETKHDVIAFVSNVAENVGPAGKYIHFGMTSSDVLDTALSLQIREAGLVLKNSMDQLGYVLKSQIKKHAKTLCAGRTHGMFAEPTTFGYKLAGFYSEHLRNLNRLNLALKQIEICKMSGAVGTYSNQSPLVEIRVAKRLKLTPETIATQVIPRDRHAELFFAISMIGSSLERLSVELRHLQRSEVAEVTEGFSRGQKGSSAMPHKKNPISAENITGASRLLRGYLFSALENIPLWHERDISHSSVERVIFPDAFILCDYAVHRMAQLLEKLDVNKKQMLENIERSQGQLYSSQVLTALVKKGFVREQAYMHIQRLCHSMGRGDHLKNLIKKDSVLGSAFKNSELNDIFSGKASQKTIDLVLKRMK